MSIVREFYVNVLDAVDDKAMVRDLIVYFGTFDINLFYDIKDVGHGEYEVF